MIYRRIFFYSPRTMPMCEMRDLKKMLPSLPSIESEDDTSQDDELKEIKAAVAAFQERDSSEPQTPSSDILTPSPIEDKKVLTITISKILT